LSLSGFALEKQFPCRYEHLHFDAGVNHMDGDTALKFGRSRHTSSDFDRGIRQMSIILAVKDKLFKLNSLNKIPQFFAALVKSVRTDLSVESITTLTPILKTIPDMKMEQIGLDTTNVLTNSQSNSGAYILLPKNGADNWQETQHYIKQQMGN
jgi:anionic cell wall polymer biosynthesis LytR-Cps2A-Psr (LCP) family protein